MALQEAKDIVATTRDHWNVSFDIMDEQMKSAGKELLLVEQTARTSEGLSAR